MVHIGGRTASRVTARSAGIELDRLVAVPIDVGKSTAVAMACDLDPAGGWPRRPGFALDRSGVQDLAGRVSAALPGGCRLVRVGVEACGHYHRPLLGEGLLPDDWQLLELNPAWVSAQRKINGSARTKTDPTDLVAIADLLLAGRGYEVPQVCEPLVELAALGVSRFGSLRGHPRAAGDHRAGRAAGARRP